jgi:hypothetical protein
MKGTTRTIIIIIALIGLLGAFGCTNNTDPSTPSSDSSFNANAFTAENPGRQIVGEYTLRLDTTTGEIDIVEKRSAQRRYNISNFIGPYTDKVWSCYLDSQRLWIFDLQLTNPSKFTAYDVRAILEFNPYSGDYLTNPDDYTGWWNSVHEEYVNGFIAYAKNVDNRAFKPNAVHTEQFMVYENTPPGQILEMDLIIDCSWPHNTTDPYEISGQHISGKAGARPVTITVEVYDHYNGPVRVWVETGAITGGPTMLEHIGGPFWSATIRNTEYAPSGTYRCRITADSYYGPEQEYRGDQLCDYIDIEVL